MNARSKYISLFSLYRWLAAYTNSQSFKARAQEDCGDLEGVVAYRIHSYIYISWADTAHQVFPSFYILTRANEKDQWLYQSWSFDLTSLI